MNGSIGVTCDDYINMDQDKQYVVMSHLNEVWAITSSGVKTKREQSSLELLKLGPWSLFKTIESFIKLANKSLVTNHESL